MTNFMASYSPRGQPPPEGLSAVNGLIVDGAYLDGSWELCVHVEDIHDAVCVRVRGDTSVGGLMHQIVENVNIKQSWSDHSIWWPQRNMWLLHTRTSLDQYGVQSDAQLVFRRTHGNLKIVLPSLTTLTLRVNYASRVFSVVEAICKELCIRHSEELSLMFPITRASIKYNQPLPVIRHGIKRSGPLNSIGAARSELPAAATNGVNKAVSLNRLNDSNPYTTLPYGSATLMRGQSDNSLNEEHIDISKFLDCSQRKSAKVAFEEEWVLKPKNVQQKARMDGGWLDSSRSLMEHGIEPPIIPVNDYTTSQPEPPTLYLRFKFYNFYDLNANYDAVRIHQIYEQARWSLLSGNLECTEDEMVVFAAYQLQAELQNESALLAKTAVCSGGNGGSGSGSGTSARYNTLYGYNTLGSPIESNLPPMSPDFSPSRSFRESFTPTSNLLPPSRRPLSPFGESNGHEALNEMDEIDAMLTELEQSCNVSHQKRESSLACDDALDGRTAPILQDMIKVFRDKGLLLRRYKEMWVVVKGTNLIIYRDPHSIDLPSACYNLRDCLITPDLSPENFRFAIKLSLVVNPPTLSPSTSGGGRRARVRGREEVWLRFNSMDQYAKWVATFRLAGRGKSLESRVTFEKELQLVRETLEKEAAPRVTAILSPEELNTRLGDLKDFCAERIIKKARSREILRQRISETHAGYRDLSLQDAKLRYLEEWQRVNHFGRSYCVVQFDKNNCFGLGSSSGGMFSSPGPQEDVIAIRQGRIEVVSPSTEETQLAWNFADLRSWNVNWDNGRVILDFRNGKVSFKPLTANCKCVVELIGGYVFLSQRNPEKNQKLDERLFHKLTGVND